MPTLAARLIGWMTRGQPAWARACNQLERLFATAAGLEMGRANAEHRPYNLDSALMLFVRLARPGWSSEECANFVVQALLTGASFARREEVRAALLRRLGSAQSGVVDELVFEFGAKVTTRDNQVQKLHVLAELVKDELGSEQAAELLAALIVGEVR